ncbi:uncharacterized protein LOC143040322 isoform X2 [Oratosquilla oratoria]|uniref:uncharacterized protein LOC143040322 isoform X2 n=1 Tax=Oratosquilla oratoria TaxID=337810 RepID=UPI003F775D1C
MCLVGTMDYRKSITCRYWKKGFCLNGEECPYLHGFSAKAKKQRKPGASRYQGLVEETHMNDETQGDEFWEPIEDSGDHNGDSWDGCDQRFDEQEGYGHWEGVDEDTITALLGRSSTWSEEAQYSDVKKRNLKRKSWSGPNRKNYPHELGNEDFRIAKDVEKFLRRERNRIEGIVDKCDDKEFETSRGSPIFDSECGNFGSASRYLSSRNSRREESERFDRSPKRLHVSPTSSRHRSLERQNYSSLDRNDYRSPGRTRHKSADRDRHRSESRNSSPMCYDYRSPERSRHRSTDQDKFRSTSQTRHFTPDPPRIKTPDRVRDWSQENWKHNLEQTRGRNLESDKPKSKEWSRSWRPMKSRQWNPEQPQSRPRSSERLGHRNQARGHKGSERLRSPVRGHRWSPEPPRYRSPERPRCSPEQPRYRSHERPGVRSHDWQRHNNSERTTYRSPRRSRQRSPKRPRVTSPEKNRYDDMNSEPKQVCTNYKLILHRYESPVLSESSSSDYPGSCSRGSSRNDNHSKELSTVSHKKESCSKSEGQIQDKASISKVDLQLFEKRILSNCQELLASLKDPSKLGELLKLQDQQISAELCKGSLTSSVVPQDKDTSGEKNSNKKSRSAKEDHNESPTYDNIKIVVDCKKTEETIDETIDRTRQVVLVEGGKSAESDISKKDSEQNKYTQNVDSEKSKISGNGFQKDSGANECDTSVSEEVSCQVKKRPRGCNKQESSFREEEDNYESVVEEVSQELDDVLEALKEMEDSGDSDEEPEKCVVLQENSEKTLQKCAADIVLSLKEGSKTDSLSAISCNMKDTLVKSVNEFQVENCPLENEKGPVEMHLRNSSKTLVKLNCDSDEKKPFAKVQPYSITITYPKK